jgi:hypothetical protein
MHAMVQYNNEYDYDTDLLWYNGYNRLYESGLLYNTPMLYGGGGYRSQSTLCDELNRLANGGVEYPPITQYVDICLAANIWAGTTGKDIVGALNIKAGLSQIDWQNLAGICNTLAGTKGLEATAALRFVEA